jgi:hypothetical protein
MAFDARDRLAPERRRRDVAREYRIYFVAIFLLIALPTALWQWTAGVLQPRGNSPNPGVAQRALSEARVITTTIFSA